ncbi:hypothetical protein CPter291_2969 [Collimonas pratensis]|uniref:Uncharacterized protein n=1 Tax=Collimonas pratensis TaxID=279113 RepID=A0ABM5Z846_9BURK|nr:hypothetical protein CPter291_2969 [Collimonas pratensis]
MSKSHFFSFFKNLKKIYLIVPNPLRVLPMIRLVPWHQFDIARNSQLRPVTARSIPDKV